MADDVRNVITGGIGAAPGGLVWFLTGGLEAGEAVIVVTPVARTIRVPRGDRAMNVSQGSRVVIVPPSNRVTEGEP
jgi:hypothetical protein